MTTGVGNVVIGNYAGVAIATNTGTLVLSDGNGAVKMGFTSTGAMFVGSTITNFGASGQALLSNGPTAPPYWGDILSPFLLMGA
jgi:hypothetical protein